MKRGEKMKKLMVLPTLLLGLVKDSSTPQRGKRFRRLALFVTVVGVLVFSSIGTTSAHIDSLAPNQWTAGGRAFTLRILGTDFVDTGDDDSDTRRIFFDGINVE